VFVCDHLAVRSEIRRGTEAHEYGALRSTEALAKAVDASAFREQEQELVLRSDAEISADLPRHDASLIEVAGIRPSYRWGPFPPS